MLLPSQTSKDPVEKALAKWLTNKKIMKKVGPSKLGAFYESDQRIVESFGFSELFVQYNPEIASNEMTNKLCDFIGATGRTPKMSVKEEFSMAKWLNRKRQANKGKGAMPFYESDNKVAEKRGYADLFLTEDSERHSNVLCRSLCTWIQEYGKTPVSESKDGVERRLGAWLLNRRGAKKGTYKGVFYTSDQKIADDFGFPYIFDTEDLEKISNEMCLKVCKFIQQHGIKPKASGVSCQERQLGAWLSNKKSARNGNKNWRFFESDQRIAESLGCPSLFEPINKEEKSNEKTTQVCVFFKENKRFPIRTSKNKDEKHYAEWLAAKKKASSGKGTHTFYDSDQEIAESLGCPSLFNQRSKD